MARKIKEAVIFVVNTGSESAEILENEHQSFLDKSKNVIKQILERKIFVRKKDATNVICFGANETLNGEDMDNIYQFEPDLRIPTWEIVQKVLDLQATEHCSSWVEGLHVALKFVQKDVNFVETIKVIVINNFKENPDLIKQFKIQDVVNEVVEAKVELMIIGSSDYDEENLSNLSSSHQFAVKVYHKLISESVRCAHDQIDNYLKETRFYLNPPVKPTPWRCQLQIGKITIRTETYVKATEPPPFPVWKLTTRNDSVGFPPESEVDVKRTREYVDRYRNVTEDKDATKGFKYGGTFIPFSGEDIAKAQFKGTSRSLIIRGFVKQQEVSLEYWFGKGSHIIVPEGNHHDKNKFYALLILMKKAGLVAIVRKVYNTNTLPRMAILFPRLEKGEIACFVQVGMPFVEERRVLIPREEVSLPSVEQQKDTEDYINSMTLPPGDERYQPGSFGNPCKQNKWDNLSHRALNRVPLPPMDKYLMDLISPPESLVKNSEPVLERLAKFVKPKMPEVKKKDEIEDNEQSVNDDKENDIKTEEELILAAEEAEKENKYRDELFNEISESTMAIEEDLLNDM